MFKVLIIDDEPIIRKGLKNILNWKQFNCELCGQACDGLEGIDLIKKHLPDIIISDIRMPEVDGLTMIKQIKDIIPNSKIILLTGYRDFNYAQQAIKLGAFDFLLKPSKINDLTAVIRKAVKELELNRKKQKEFDKIKKNFEQNIPVLREKLLNDIIFRINTDKEEILEKMKLYDIDIKKFILLVVENDEQDQYSQMNQYDKQLYQFGIINTFEEVFTDIFRIQSIALNNKQVAFMMSPLESIENYMKIIEEKSNDLQQIVASYFDFTITIAVSTLGKDIMQLPFKLKECLDALEYKFYIGNNSIILFSDLNSFYQNNDQSMLDHYHKSLLDQIKTGNKNNVKKVLQQIYEYLNHTIIANKKIIKNFYFNMIYSIDHMRSSIGREEEKNFEHINIPSVYHLIEQCEKIVELHEILENISLQTTSKINSFNETSIKLIIKKAIHYLKEHYNESITLNDVAEHTYVSTYYISRMFKKELGKSFVDYLNEIRIEKAKELLKDVKYKTYEIAEMVGIADAHYFSKQFKKYTGVTPTEYRESQSGV